MPEADPAPLLWPFPVQAPLEEVLEWRTDVLATQTGEQRIALRPVPREIVTLRHRLDAHGMARAAELARAGFAGTWRVPLWHMTAQPGAALAQGDMEIAIDTGQGDFRAPGLTAIAVDRGEAALIEVAAVQPDRLVLAAPLDQQLPASTVAAHRVAVAPVRDGILTKAVDLARRRQGDGDLRARFLLRDTPDLAAPTLRRYLGLPVQTDPSLLRRPLTASLARSVAYIDNGYGPVIVEP
ncbi:hypothetical protein, partial [Rhodosalinus sp.]|uniref:hypothetical protein n=1 Tax=Rhodosalinus sp. TaxID=2047741 RepID=UPI00356AE99C